MTLTCPRQKSLTLDNLYWIRLVSGGFPEFLGGTFVFDYDGVNKTPHITARQQPGSFTVQISKTKQNDSGVYFCVKVQQLNMEVLTVIFLNIKGK